MPSIFLLLVLLGACGQLGTQDGGPGAAQWREAAIGYDDPLAPAATPGPTVVTGSGADIWNDHDEFYYVFTELVGDGLLEARLADFDAPDPWSKAGLMIREDLSPDARNVLLHTSRDNGAVLQARTDAGGLTTNEAGKDPDARTGEWMRIEREGDLITGWLSRDGGTWRELGSYRLDLPEQVLVGFAVTSHQPGEWATATFEEADYAPETVPDAPAPPPADDPGGDDGSDPPSSDPAQAFACGSTPLSPAYAPTYYVATNGSDAADGRSPSRPFRTLQRAADVVGPGDVVWIRGGVYGGSLILRRSGTASAPIVFESYPGECATIDGSGRGSGPNVRFSSVRFNILRNLVVRDAPAQGIYLSGSSDNLVAHVRTHGNYLSGIQTVGGDRNRFAWFVTHDNYGGGDSDGIGLSSGSGNRVDHCVTYRNSDDGIDTWRSYDTVVERCVAFENGYNGGDGQGVKAGGGLTSRTIVRYSLAFDNAANGFDHNSSDQVTFDHNTAWGNASAGFVAGDGTLRNNLAYANGLTAFRDRGGNAQATNSWNVRIGDPRFVSTSRGASGFLALAAGSPAIDAGTPIGLPSDGTAPDLGALPYGDTITTFLGFDLGAAID